MIHTILLVDECPMVRRGMAQFLETVDRFRVVGEAGGGEEGLRVAEQLRPDVIVIEPNFTVHSRRNSRLPEMELCRDLKELPHAPHVVVYTAYDSPADVASTVLAGASGYLHKGLGEESFASALKELLEGGSRWIFGLDEEYASEVTRTAIKLSRLSAREKDIFPLLLRRYSSKEVAAELYLRPQTVQNNVGNILRKLDCQKRSELYERWKT